MKRSLLVSLPLSIALHLVALVSLLVLLREDSLDRVLFVDLTETGPGLRHEARAGSEPARPARPTSAARREPVEGDRSAPAHERGGAPIAERALATGASAAPLEREVAPPAPAPPDTFTPPREEVVPSRSLSLAAAHEREPASGVKREDHASRDDQGPGAVEEHPRSATARREDAAVSVRERGQTPAESGHAAPAASDTSGPKPSTAGHASSAIAEARGGVGAPPTGAGAAGGGGREGRRAGLGGAREPVGSAAAGNTLATATPGPGPGGDGEYLAYLRRIRRRLQEALQYPPAARRRSLAGTVHIEILVRPDGTIGDAAVVASSSHRILDEAALEAIRRLPRVPFPDGLPPRTLRARLPVVFELR